MKILDTQKNTCLGVIAPYNKEIIIKIVCSTCENDKFDTDKIIYNCETGFKVLETVCTYCGKRESYKYNENVFIKTNGDKI